jgi:anti-anti-sigma factor
VPTAYCPVEDMALGDHCCYVFDDDDTQRQVARTYVRTGLARGEKVVYLANGKAPEELSAMLGDLRDEQVRDGQMVVLGARETYLQGGRFDKDRMITMLHDVIGDAVAEGHQGCRITGEMSWWQYGLPGTEHLAAYERQVHQVLDAGEAMGLCQYDERVFGADLEPFMRAHAVQVESPPVYADTLVRIVRINTPHRGLRVTGELDISNHAALGDLLAARTAETAEGDVYVEVSALTFVDVQGMRTLVRAASALTGGRRLVLLGPSPGTVELLRIAAWDQAPNLVIAEDHPPKG